MEVQRTTTVGGVLREVLGIRERWLKIFLPEVMH